MKNDILQVTLTLLVISILVAIALLLVPGCAQQREDAVAAMGKEVLFKIVTEAKLDNTTMSANGQAVNPEYEYDWFGGTGIYSKGKIRVIGVQLNAEAAGAGTGGQTLDPDTKEKLYEILMNTELSKTERQKKWNEVWTGAVKNYTSPTTQPVVETPK